MADAAAAPYPASGAGVRNIWSRMKGLGKALINTIVIRAKQAWAWTKANASAAWVWSAATAMNVGDYIFLGAAKTGAYLMYGAAWTWNNIITAVGYIGGAVAWGISGVLSFALLAFGSFGFLGTLVALVVIVAAVSMNNVFQDFVVAPLRWMRLRGDSRSMVRYVRDQRAARKGSYTSFEPVVVQMPPVQIPEPVYPAEGPGSVFHMNETMTDDINGGLYNLNDETALREGGLIGSIIDQMILTGTLVPVKHNFASVMQANPDLDKDGLRALFQFFHDSATTKRERSYWQGRIAVLDIDPDRNTLIHDSQFADKAWALYFQKHRGQQATFNRSYLEAGFRDMVNELGPIFMITDLRQRQESSTSV